MKLFEGFSGNLCVCFKKFEKIIWSSRGSYFWSNLKDSRRTFVSYRWNNLKESLGLLLFHFWRRLKESWGVPVDLIFEVIWNNFVDPLSFVFEIVWRIFEGPLCFFFKKFETMLWSSCGSYFRGNLKNSRRPFVSYRWNNLKESLGLLCFIFEVV